MIRVFGVGGCRVSVAVWAAVCCVVVVVTEEVRGGRRLEDKPANIKITVNRTPGGTGNTLSTQ